jgi:hypothetical protein
MEKDKTTIWISNKNRENLESLKIIPEEYIDTVLTRVINTSSLIKEVL